MLRLFLIPFIFTSCIQLPDIQPENISNRNGRLVDQELIIPVPRDLESVESGFDMEGELKNCHDPAEIMPGMACTTEMKTGDYYAVLCQEEGGDAINCGCHDNICSIDISEGGLKEFGMDKDHQFRSCVPTATLDQCEGNTFTQHCEQSGGEVIACDCQNFLCRND